MNSRVEDVLIDSSGWIQLLRRKGEPLVKKRVRELMTADRAVWCNIIQLELWRGGIQRIGPQGLAKVAKRNTVAGNHKRSLDSQF